MYFITSSLFPMWLVSSFQQQWCLHSTALIFTFQELSGQVPWKDYEVCTAVAAGVRRIAVCAPVMQLTRHALQQWINYVRACTCTHIHFKCNHKKVPFNVCQNLFFQDMCFLRTIVIAWRRKIDSAPKYPVLNEFNQVWQNLVIIYA